MSPTHPETIQSALAHARQRVDASDARALLSALIERSTAFLISHADESLTAEQALTYRVWVDRRAAGEPVAYITGWREFYGRMFRVTSDVLIPRPETELLIDVALETLRLLAGGDVLDLGTGSGCIAITLAAELASAHVTAVDASPAALAVARANAGRLGIADIEWRVGEWFAAVGARRYDVIVSNPPYVAEGDRHLTEGDVRYEPRTALTSGVDGLDAIRTIVTSAPAHLESGGWLWLEHGYDQGAPCRELLSRAGFADVATRRDLAGLERVTGGRRR